MKKFILNAVVTCLFILFIGIDRGFANDLAQSGKKANYYILTFAQSSFVEGDSLHPFIGLQKVDDENLCKNTAAAFQQKHGSLEKCLVGTEKESDGKTSDERYAPYFKKLPQETTYISYNDTTGREALFIFAEDPTAVSSKMISIVVNNLEKGGAKELKVVYPSN